MIEIIYRQSWQGITKEIRIGDEDVTVTSFKGQDLLKEPKSHKLNEVEQDSFEGVARQALSFEGREVYG